MAQELADSGMRELRSRWRAMFESLRDGGDVSPSQRLRVEGIMEALVLLELAEAQAIQLALASCYEQVFEESLAARWGEDWSELFPFPQIPAFGQRAPVYPSTRD